jgi:hypothetical protein
LEDVIFFYHFFWLKDFQYIEDIFAENDSREVFFDKILEFFNSLKVDALGELVSRLRISLIRFNSKVGSVIL